MQIDIPICNFIAACFSQLEYPCTLHCLPPYMYSAANILTGHQETSPTVEFCLQVYLPLSYLYGMRATGELTPLVMSLREELYTKDYSRIDWNAARNQCAKEDLYYPHPWYQVPSFSTLIMPFYIQDPGYSSNSALNKQLHW